MIKISFQEEIFSIVGTDKSLRQPDLVNEVNVVINRSSFHRFFIRTCILDKRVSFFKFDFAPCNRMICCTIVIRMTNLVN